jgi:ribokinase
VVGHVEVVEFARVDRVPGAGEIVAAGETWTQAAGGGAVAARQLKLLAGEVTFFTAIGDDDLGRGAVEELTRAGIEVEPALRRAPQRRCFVFVDAEGERTITTIGEKLVPHAADPLPWHRLVDFDAVYFCGGDAAALRSARRARILVATARELPTLREAAVEIDALVHSGSDESERYAPGDLDPPPALVVTTDGPRGGRWASSTDGGRWEPEPAPAAVADQYGAGDCFAAGVSYALAQRLSAGEAVALGARCAAAAITVPGARL